MKQKIDVNELCKILGVKPIDDWYNDLDASCTYGIVLKETGSEEKAQEAEQEELGEAYRKYYDAVLSVAKELFGAHELELVGKVKHDRPFEFYVLPINNWKSSAARIMTTINGVGMFEFSSVNEFLRSGPYTPTKAVMSHLHWIADWPNVYEGTKAASMVYGRMR